MAGPAEYTYREIVQYVNDVTMCNTPLVEIPEELAMFGARWVEQLYRPMVTPDMILHMKENIVLPREDNAYTLADLGITPTSIDNVGHGYLHMYRRGRMYNMPL